MAKKDTDLFDRLRDAGLRKQVAKTLSDLSESASKKAHEQARGLTNELRSLADEIERRLPSVAPRASTRKSATSTAARKPASATTRRKPATSTAARKPASATTARTPAASRAAAKPKPRASSGGAAAAAKPAARTTRAKRPTGSTRRRPASS
jgi:hypothetical protein